MPPEAKKDALQDDFGFQMTEKLEKELNAMCNLSSEVFEDGMTRGMEQGTAGERRRIIQNFSEYEKDVDKIAAMLGVSADEVRAVLETAGS